MKTPKVKTFKAHKISMSKPQKVEMKQASSPSKVIKEVRSRKGK